MSRSVKQDFDSLREPQHVYAREGVNVRYIGATIPLTEEQVFWMMADTNPEFERKAEAHNVSPTNEDWAKYHLAKRALLTLQAYENTIGAEEVEIPMPKPYTDYRFTETNEAWLERCRALDSERKAA